MSKYDHIDLEQLMEQIRHELDNDQSVPQQSPQDVTAGRLPTSEIMRRVRAEVARRRAGVGEGAAIKNPVEETTMFPRWQTAVPKLAAKREYVLGEFLAFSDIDFVSTVFRILLRRDPSQGEVERYLTHLRDGLISKIEILGEIRWSREGVARGVHVDGLLVPYTLRKWERLRFVGPILRWLHALVKLGHAEHRYSLEAARHEHEIRMLGETLNCVSSALNDWRNDLDGRLATFSSREEIKHQIEPSVREVATQLASLDTAVSSMQSKVTNIDSLLAGVDLSGIEWIRSKQERLRAQVEQLAGQLRRMQEQAELKLTRVKAEYESGTAALHERSSALLGAQRRVEQIIHTLANMSVPQPLDAISAELKSLAAQLIENKSDVEQRFTELSSSAKVEPQHEPQHHVVDLDPFYVAFEDHFRGGRDLVRQRVEPYIEMVRGAMAGTREAPVLDIGCGRGEWLELLREHGLAGRGIDLNRIFVEICRGNGLDVAEGDAIGILSAMPDSSVGAITSMHLVEHLPFEQLVILLDEARRVLMPGGLLLLETPNPENLGVGSHTFYLDPTHKNPIPPAALQWMVQARGFQDVSVERLTVARELNAPPLLSEDIPGASSVNFMLAQFNVAPDYAVMAKKP